MPSKHAGRRPGSHSNNLDISMLLDDFLTPKKSNCVKTPMKKKTPGCWPLSVKRSPVARRSTSLSATAPPINETALDVKALLEGAENWDWADMEADFMTPKKPQVKSRTVAMTANRHAKETCTRCVVDNIRDDRLAVIQKVWKPKAVLIALCHERVLQVLSVRVQSSGDLRTVILCDDWVDADIRKGKLPLHSSFIC
ncbi:hypothetical protein BDR05DRAFT_1006149 [Suillus weaverae]|nr:hypothetical protein BDR05DRAFT_1006149 [Suillus weaverae]